MPRRRRKSSIFEDLFDIAVMLPWWVGLLLAAVAFIIFHSTAQIDIVHPSQAGDIGHNISRQLFKTFSSILRYVVPAIFCLGAAGSFFGRRKRRKLFDQVQSEQTTLSDLSWKEFELLVGEAFRQRGYTVAETGSGADGGIDLVLIKNSERFLVQCKHWKSAKVSVMVVRELLGVMTSQGAKGGFVVASEVFTKDAELFAQRNCISLIGREELYGMIQAARSSIQTHQNRATLKNRTVEEKVAIPNQPHTINCPACHSPMVKRVATRGNNSGSEFWGCSRFPKCRATIAI